MSSLVAFAECIEQSKIGTAIAESRYWWPIFEGTHLLSLSISFGLIFVTDLRLLGLWLRRVPVTDVLHQLRPYVLGGFALTFLSGGLVFWSEAATVVVSPLWTVKILLILLGGWRHAWPSHHVSDWRGASAKANSLMLGPYTPVIYPSPFIEAKPPVWRPVA